MAQKKGNKPKSQWTAKARAEALVVYLETGSSIVTSGKTGIPASTIRNWVSSDPEWADAGGQITRAIRDLVRSEARGVVSRAFMLLHTSTDAATLNAANNMIKTMAHTASLLEGEPTERGDHRFSYTQQGADEALRSAFGFSPSGSDSTEVQTVPEDVAN